MNSVAGFLRRKMRPLHAFAVSSLVLVGMLGWMIEHRAAILRDGVEVILKTAPVDPRDLMRGDYVQLRYEAISSVDGSLFVGDLPEREGLVSLWLTLKANDGGIATVKSVSLNKPELAGPGEAHLKSLPYRWTTSLGKGTAGEHLSLRFGIERYYVPEGEGLVIEEARNDHRTTVAIRISADGEAQIARLMIDGKPLYDEPLY